MKFDLRLFLERHRYTVIAGALIFCGLALRLILTLLGWPSSDSEEGTMGLEAMHILQRGDLPVYFYGQNYMGVIEAYLASVSYRIFGISTVSLRLGMIALYTVFLVGTYVFASLLYSRRVALASLAVLIVASPFVLQMELLADGGKVETLAFGASMFALASWLALTSPTSATSRGRGWQRAIAFAAWGLIAGLALYTYLIVAPFVVMSGLLLVLGCWREVRSWKIVLPLVGLGIGLAPAFLYWASKPVDGNPVAVFNMLHSFDPAKGSGLHLLARQFDATLLFTLPTMTGLPPVYPLQALPFYGPLTSATVVAVVIGGGWSAVYLALLALATYRPSRALWVQVRAVGIKQVLARLGSRDDAESSADAAGAHPTTRDLARLLLVLAAWLTIAAYIASPIAAYNPGSGRYLVGLLIVVPAILWLLLERTPSHTVAKDGQSIALWQRVWRPLTLAVLACALVIGFASTLGSVSASQAFNRQQAAFQRDLLTNSITRFYSDYWTCDLVNFETREGVICSVVQDYGKPGPTRYTPYTQEVQADPRAPYVLVTGSEMDRTFQMQASATNTQYTVRILDGYTIYTPISA